MMNELETQRKAMTHLLYERNPDDAISAYFAFYHKRTQLVLHPNRAEQATGYMALARTGVDLFRPFVTLRLPANMDNGVALVYEALPEQTAVILNIRQAEHPLISALFDIQTDEQLQLMTLDLEQFRPEINVLVAQTSSNNEHPRFVVRSSANQNEVGASATINWQTDHFAEIGVTTVPQYRRRGWGRSVVVRMAEYILKNGRHPLYVTATHNQASIQLAESVGFVDTGLRHHLMQAVLRPKP